MRHKLLILASVLVLLFASCSCKAETTPTTSIVYVTNTVKVTQTTTQTETKTATVTETTTQTETTTLTIIPIKVKRLAYGHGQVERFDMESEYLPIVVASENPEAPLESLKAQAIAARTYAFYKMIYEPSGDNFDVWDSEADQVYNPDMWDRQTPETQQRIKEAIKATYGIVLKYSKMVICSCYVSGTASKIQYVTFNEGKSGDNITQTTLISYSSPPSSTPHNRGCMGQIQANDLAANKGYTYDMIIKYFYGADIVIEKYSVYN
jgi:peptidoglycan hydrolase-like amidase